MNTKIYSGISGAARGMTGIYLGVEGRARKVTAVYAGVDNRARLVWKTKPPAPIFKNNSWEEIGQAIARNQLPDEWTVGSEKDLILIDGSALPMVICGRNHDDLPTGGKASFTLGTVGLLSEARAINPTATNAGSFAASAAYNWLNSAFWNTLPADFRAIVKPVCKKTGAGALSREILVQEMPLFLFSEFEVLGTATTASTPGEGEMYPIFSAGRTSRVKRTPDTNAPGVWWTRSPHLGGVDKFCAMSILGMQSSFNANIPYYLSFACCI